ncbi:MAG: Crp/Fnr family transcriptional regulator, partial [Rhizobiales bacterium]|nr:Crp/Fnr family transcriptional regulator [Hyphomicrobiales bacterium]
MDMHQQVANTGKERPFNNLLRKMRTDDYALLAPHFESCSLPSAELLYNPGDDVAVVHFPCGPSLASYLIANEDGRDVETILIGREGA